jgi:tetratricopeptide (TPR) repeat protein
MSDLLISPEVIKENLHLDSQKLKQSSLSIFKRRQYEAVLRHLTQSRIALNASDDQKIQNYVHALLMLCDLGDLPRAKALLQLPVTKTKTLHEYFGHLGCYLEQCQVYEAVMDKFAAQIDLEFKAVLLDGLGWANGRLGKTDKAILLHEEALEIARDLYDQHIEVKAYYGLAEIYWNSLDNTIKSEHFYNKMLKIATEINDLKYQALAILGKGFHEYINHRYKQAINLYNQALQIGEAINDEELNIKIMSELAISYMQLDKKKISLEILDLQLEKARFMNDKRQEAVILSHYAQSYILLQNLDKAREYNRKCYQIAQGINDVSLKISFLNDISASYLRNKDFERALESLLATHQLMVVHKQISVSYVYLLSNLSYCYGCLKDFNQAITYAHKTLTLAKTINNKYLRSFAMAMIANAHWQQNRYLHGIIFIIYSFWIYPPWKDQNMRYVFLEAVRSIRNLLREKLGWFGSVTRKFHHY